jgi:hypothetical protein
LKKYLTKKELKIATSFLKDFDKDKCIEFLKYISSLAYRKNFSSELFIQLQYYMLDNNFTDDDLYDVQK